MSMKLRDLKALPEEELEKRYDESAKFTSVGLDYWREEIDHRVRERATASANRLARQSFWLAVVSSVASLLALAVAVVTLILTA